MKVAGKSIVKIGVVALAMMLVVGALSACGQKEDPEQVVRDQIASELDPLKNLDGATIDAIIADISESDLAVLQQYGIDPEAYLRAFFEGFDYNVVSVDAKGDTADVQITLTIKDMTQFDAALDTALASLDPSTVTAENTDQIVSDLILDAIGSLPTKTTDPISANFSLKDKMWTDGDALSATVAEAMFS